VRQGLDVVIVNPAVVVGAGDLNRISGAALLAAARGALWAAPSGGLNAVHIDDVVAGHLAAMQTGRTGERYILGGENMPHREFLGLAAAYAGRPAPRLVVPGGLLRAAAGPLGALGRLATLPISGEALRRAGYYFYYDTLKSRLELGLGEARPVRLAVTEALDWYRERGEL
jgi:dihydroflavonol-4-reductase